MNYSVLLKHTICFLSPNFYSCCFLCPKWPFPYLGHFSRSNSDATLPYFPNSPSSFSSSLPAQLEIFCPLNSEQNNLCFIHISFESLWHSLLSTFRYSYLYLVLTILYLWIPEGRDPLVFISLPSTVLTGTL